MALEIGEDEIEEYLVVKIRFAINQSVEPKNLVTKLYSFNNEFTSLLNDLQRTTNPKVRVGWPSIKRGNLYSLNNLVTEWQMIKNHTSFSATEVYEACENIKKSLKKIRNEINGGESGSKDDPSESISQHQQPDHPSFERNTREVYRWSSRHAPKRVHGIEHKVLAMERDLVLRNINAPFKAFGVVGAPGIGKTTLCQTIFGRDSVKERFCPRIWVCLSKQPNSRIDYREEIVVRILKCLGVDDEIINETVNDEVYGLKRLILLLRLQLTGKRYLIVLDDAWEDDCFFYNLTKKDRLGEDWGEELAYGLPKGCGGTVISSSTSEKLLKKMLGRDVILEYLEPLKNEIIYEIFIDAVTGYIDDEEREFNKDLDILKEELLKMCDGVPFAAKLLAKIAWEKLDIKLKSEQTATLKSEQTAKVDGESSRDGKQASTGGHDGDSGFPQIGDDQAGKK